MRNAAEWDERYSGGELVWSAEPNRWVAEVAAGLPPGTAIDLAAGEARNSLWLAGLGWSVTAVDFSQVGLEKGRLLAERLGIAERLAFDCRDLTAYVPEPGAYDLVLLAYLHLDAAARPAIVRRAADAVAPGGRLLIVGHDLANLTRGVGGPQDPGVLYTGDELRAEIDGSSLTVESAGERLRPVEGQDRPAVDVVLLASRAAPSSGAAANRVRSG
ncbi:MAG TPA: class I SAM-dependent methyltransferase [Frankiaceae bacterium]|jgi:SAM-dependent methyltransferase|nr:class I SAM-dependent methyltransferase [Frankiaceae bacterium]